jgi:hypothetical protein
MEYSRSSSSASARRIGRMTHFIVALLYVFAHSMVLFYLVVTLNVAVNSYNASLLTLLISNQFVEIKGSVFKRFERENLFQLSCSGEYNALYDYISNGVIFSDIVERFQLSVFLFIIMTRNFFEQWGGDAAQGVFNFVLKTALSVVSPLDYFSSLHSALCSILWDGSLLRSSITALIVDPLFFIYRILSQLYILFSSVPWKAGSALLVPVTTVYITEILVDWLKHAFITKFNQIRPNIYSRYADSLCRDLIGGRMQSATDTTKSLNTSGELVYEINFHDVLKNVLGYCR